jgi:hypothetical protein
MIWGKIYDDRLRFGISLGLGVISGICLFLLLKLRIENKKIEGKGLINCFSIILALLSLFVSIKPEAFYKCFQSDEITNLYDTPFDIESCFNEINNDKHYVIFAFDKTAYKGKNVEIPVQLQEKYLVDINKFKDVYEVKNVELSYREFCRAMLCAKLYTLNKENVQGKFSVYLIENETELKFEGDINDKETIRKTIVLLYNIDFYDDKSTETDLLDFYEKLRSTITDNFNQHEFTKYVVYVYSDFVHDKQYRNKDVFNDHIEKIQTIQKELDSKSIIQNLYKIPHMVKDIENLRKCVLDTNIVKPQYKNIFLLETYKPHQNEHDYSYHKVKQVEKGLPIFYSNSEVGCSPNLLFSGKYFIRIEQVPKTTKPLTIYLNEAIITEEFSPITEHTASVKYRGHISKDLTLYLDIAKENGIHCVFKLEFKEMISSLWKFLIPSFCFISGCWVALFIGWIIVRIKSH